MVQRANRMNPLAYAIVLMLLAACSNVPEAPQRPAPASQTQPAPAYQTPERYPHTSQDIPTPSAPAAGAPVKVGLLLPLSGNAATVGQAMRDAAVLALFDKYATLHDVSDAPRVELITKDTYGTPEGAQKAAAEAVREGASLLLGPLFAASVEALRPLAETGKVTILSFSNNQEVAGKGVFTMGFNPAQQAERVAKFAYAQGLHQVAALAPNDAYGREVTGAFSKVAQLMGRPLKPVIRYAGSNASLAEDIRTLVREGSSGTRINFSALFLPEGGERLGPILHGLETVNVSPKTVQFIGTGLWDDRDIIRNHNLDGAWLASSPPEGYNAFEQRFINSYDYKPPRIASLAYDAVALAATLAMQPTGLTQAAITNPNGYYGPANGIFRFRKNGSTERGLAVLKVDGKQGFTIVDPAPVKFD